MNTISYIYVIDPVNNDDGFLNIYLNNKFAGITGTKKPGKNRAFSKKLS